MTTIECCVQESPVDSLELRRTLPSLPQCGGYASFEGLIRSVNHGRRVVRLEYEAYDELALKELRRICEAAAERFKASFIRAVHRKGVIDVGQVAVVIQVLTAHRREAFGACRAVIDQLKANVPIWKKEVYEDGGHAWTLCSHHQDLHDHHR
jgi:molybdopterin synthase catalytic subunit